MRNIYTCIGFLVTFFCYFIFLVSSVFFHSIIGTLFFSFLSFLFFSHIIRLDILEGQYRPSCLFTVLCICPAVTPCVKIQTSTAMQRGGWEAVISQKHTTSFESRVTYKHHSQPRRALFGLIVVISSSSVGTSPFPLKCLWPIRFQWHSNTGPGQTHNKHWHKHILASTQIF